VKRNGLLGTAYMAGIRPFRQMLVYPRMLRDIDRQWQARTENTRSGDRLLSSKV
jgi:hypothetical protein